VYSVIGRSPQREKWGQAIDLRHHENAIALGFGMDRPLLECAPDFPTLLATAHGYADGAWVAIQLARYIRSLGYAARAHHLYNYQVLCVPIAVDCGLGELSRAGYLLNKRLGLGLRLAIVTTDMPVAHDGAVDIGVQSFCETCKICAEQCPIGAIPSGDKVVCNGVKKWKLDEEKCYRYWHAKGTDCGICMAACPWTKRDTVLHRAMAELASRPGPHQSLLTAAHKLVYRSYRSAKPPAFMSER
jgi:reductive dehalogenase